MLISPQAGSNRREGQDWCLGPKCYPHGPWKNEQDFIASQNDKFITSGSREKRESQNELQAFWEMKTFIHVCKKSMQGMFNSICLGGLGDENLIKSDKNNKVI